MHSRDIEFAEIRAEKMFQQGASTRKMQSVIEVVEPFMKRIRLLQK